MTSARMLPPVPLVLLVMLVLPIAVTGDADCRCKEKLHNGMGYLLCSCEKTWENANTYCADSYQGQLALITDSNLQDLVKSHLEDNRASDTWIGARGKVDDWHWLKNEKTIAYQGCFQDDPVDKDLNYDLRLAVVTPENCIRECKQNGYKYAGLQAGSLCYCGNTFGKHGFNTDGCSTPCSGDFNLNCGGALSNDVYSVDGIWSGGWVFGSPSGGSGGIDDQECMVYKCESFFGWSWQNERCERKFRYICMYDYDNSTCIARGLTPTAETCISIPEESPVSWFEASVACTKLGGRLLELRSALSHWAIRASLENKCQLDALWVGATKVRWTWADGSLMTYTDWATSRPTNEGDKCVAMSFKLSRVYEWSDHKCDETLSFVCERPVGPRKTTTPVTTTTSTARPMTTTKSTLAPTTTTATTTTTTTAPTTTTPTRTPSTTEMSRRTTTTTQRMVTPSTVRQRTTTESTTVASSSSSSGLPTGPSSTKVTLSTTASSTKSTPIGVPSPSMSPGPTQTTPNITTVVPPGPGEDQVDWIPIYIVIAVAAVAFLLIIACIIYFCRKRCIAGGEKKATMRVENGYSNRAGFVHDGDFAYKTPPAKNGGFSEQRAPYVAAVTPNNASRAAPPVSVVSPTTTDTKDPDFPDNVTSTVTSASSGRDVASERSSVSSSSSVYIGELEDQGVGVKYVHPRDEEEEEEVVTSSQAKDIDAGNQTTLPLERNLTKGPAPAPPKAPPPQPAAEPEPLHSQVDISTRL